MAALRCSECGINYPYRSEFAECPIHNVETRILREEPPDEDWKERAEVIAVRVAEDSIRPYPKVEGVTPHDEHGMQWVYHAELVRAGFRPSVLAGGRINQYPALFEMNGNVYEIQGWDEPNRRWWIEDLGPSPAVIQIPGGV